MNIINTGYTTPEPSTSFSDEVHFEYTVSDLNLCFKYIRDDKEFESTIRFRGVRSIRYKASIHCSLFEIENCYDTLIQIRDSKWIAELRQRMPELERNEAKCAVMNHYMIYLDSFGVLEVVARLWLAEAEKELT